MLRFALILTMFTLVHVPASAAPQSDGMIIAHKTPLAQSLETWVKLVEKNDAPSAARLAADADAVKQMAEHWEQIQQNHKKFDFRKWLNGVDGQPGALQIGDGTTFTVGGHDYGHLHVQWTRTGGEWRISKVWLCR